MAKVVLPLLSGQASGKVGDIVFMNRFGKTVARIRKKPSNPNTPAQMLTRNNLSALSQAWNGEGSKVVDGKVKVHKRNEQGMYEETEIRVLTQQERQAWEEYALQKRGYRMYGRLMFIGENVKRLRQGLDVLRTPQG